MNRSKGKGRLFFVAAALAFLVGYGQGILWASDFPQDALQEETLEENLEEKVIQPSGETFLRNRIENLERQVSQLKEQIRFLEDRTRNLDRRVDDLRRRHV